MSGERPRTMSAKIKVKSVKLKLVQEENIWEENLLCSGSYTRRRYFDLVGRYLYFILGFHLRNSCWKQINERKLKIKNHQSLQKGRNVFMSLLRVQIYLILFVFNNLNIHHLFYSFLCYLS